MISDELAQWLLSYRFNLILSICLVASYLAFKAIVIPKIEKHAAKGKLKDSSIERALRAANTIFSIVIIAAILLVWGIDFKGLLGLSASLIAVTGVALFAGWSVLSNITAFFILLVHSSFRRGNFIRVIDGDNYIEGYISEINLFNIKLISESREAVIYPNNLILTRPMIVNPRNRLETAGKLSQHATQSRTESDTEAKQAQSVATKQ